MKKRKSVMACLLLTTMMISLVGCGKDGGDDTTAPTVTEEAAGTENAGTDTETAEEAVDEEIVEEPVDTRTPIQKFWGGDWYGIMWYTAAAGDYEIYANQYWDAMGTIDVDEEGNADLLLWYEAVDKSNPVAHVQLTISEDSGSGEMGAAISESGWMLANSDTGNGDVKHADWIIDPMTDPFSAKHGNDILHIEGEYVDGSGGIYYHFFLRKWGTLWDDIAQDPEMLTPGWYEDWYKPLVAEGYAMPDNVGDPGSVKMGEETTQSSVADQEENTAPATPTGGSTYDGGELVLLDDANCKIVVKGTGCNPYNESWIGYVIELTNKSDFTIYFTSYAEPDLGVQTIDSLGTGNTCYYQGQVCKTHFGENIKAGMTMDNACLAIDGVTDESQLGNVQGYISVSNNETGEILANIPYSF